MMNGLLHKAVIRNQGKKTEDFSSETGGICGIISFDIILAWSGRIM